MAGVYADNATVYANARYHDATYDIAAGTYLAAGAETTTPCTDGNFCPGSSTPVNYNENSAQGLETCPSGFTHSDSNAIANTQCYRACDIANMGENGTIANIAHAASLTGNDYFGNGTDTCEPDSCVNGWHIKPGLNLTTLIGTVGGDGAYRDKEGIYTEQNSNHGAVAMGIESGSNKWGVYYNYNRGVVFGEARCSTVNGTGVWSGASSASDITTYTTSELGSEGGQNCYCNLKGYIPNGGTLQSLSSPWVFHSNAPNASNCADGCVSYCVNFMMNGFTDNLLFRAALFDSVLTSRVANTINISWDGATSAAVNANNAGSVTYGGDIRTPQSAIHVPGKIFVGWEFSTTAPVNPVTE